MQTIQPGNSISKRGRDESARSAGPVHRTPVSTPFALEGSELTCRFEREGERRFLVISIPSVDRKLPVPSANPAAATQPVVHAYRSSNEQNMCWIAAKYYSGPDGYSFEVVHWSENATRVFKATGSRLDERSPTSVAPRFVLSGAEHPPVPGENVPAAERYLSKHFRAAETNALIQAQRFLNQL